MNENEILVPEDEEEIGTENAEQTAEEPPKKTFTQDEVNEIVGKSKARERAKVTRQFEKKYGELEELLKAGTGQNDVEGVTGAFKKFYRDKGIPLPAKPTYSDRENEILANAEAEEIIRGGYDEVVEEVERLNQLGPDKMTPREKAVYRALANHRQNADRVRELAAIGVPEHVYNSREFQNFASKFTNGVPVTEVYDLYRKSFPKKDITPMGSMKDVSGGGLKDYYSPEEIEQLTEEELADPKVWESVRRSMTGR